MSCCCCTNDRPSLPRRRHRRRARVGVGMVFLWRRRRCRSLAVDVVVSAARCWSLACSGSAFTSALLSNALTAAIPSAECALVLCYCLCYDCGKTTPAARRLDQCVLLETTTLSLMFVGVISWSECCCCVARPRVDGDVIAVARQKSRHTRQSQGKENRRVVSIGAIHPSESWRVSTACDPGGRALYVLTHRVSPVSVVPSKYLMLES